MKKIDKIKSMTKILNNYDYSLYVKYNFISWLQF